MALVVSSAAGCSDDGDPAPEDDTPNASTTNPTSDTTTTTTTVAADTTTTTVAQESPPPGLSRGDPEAVGLIDLILSRPTTYPLRGEATLSIPHPHPRTEEPRHLHPADDDPHTRNTRTLTARAVFESDDQNNLNILLVTPTDWDDHHPHGGSYETIHKNNTVYFRTPPDWPDTQARQWLAFPTTDQHDTLTSTLTCLFTTPEPQHQQEPNQQEHDTDEAEEHDTDGGTPTGCNLQEGIHTILGNARNMRNVATENTHDTPTTKTTFNIPLLKNIPLLENIEEETLQKLLQPDPLRRTPREIADILNRTTSQNPDHDYQHLRTLIDDYLNSPTATHMTGAIWTDQTNLIHRITIDYPDTLPTPPDNTPQTARIDLTLHDHHDTGITIRTPPPQQTTAEHMTTITPQPTTD